MAREFRDPDNGKKSAITTNGIESGLKTRGFHVVVLSATDGRILKKEVFDTYIDTDASSEMIQFIDISPDGSVIIIAVQDEGTKHLSQSARDFITRLGSKYISGLQYRETMALVTSKGAPKPPWFAEESKEYTKGPTSLNVRVWL